MSFGLDISGMDGLKDAIAKAGVKLTDGLDAELTAFSIDVNRLQKTYAPVDKGVLRNSIRFDVSAKLNKINYTDCEYAGYQEFGTGGTVFLGEDWITPEIAAIAETWKGTGKRKINLLPQPFFFRAFFELKPTLIKNVQELLAE